jgi:lipopolysaccharide assembly protein A
MRYLYLLLLVIVLAPIVVFAVQNHDPVTVWFLNQSVTFALSLVIGLVYLLGMVSGSSLVGLLTRTYQHVTEPRHGQAAPPTTLAK